VQERYCRTQISPALGGEHRRDNTVKTARSCEPGGDKLPDGENTKTYKCSENGFGKPHEKYSYCDHYQLHHIWSTWLAHLSIDIDSPLTLAVNPSNDQHCQVDRENIIPRRKTILKDKRRRTEMKAHASVRKPANATMCTLNRTRLHSTVSKQEAVQTNRRTRDCFRQ